MMLVLAAGNSHAQTAPAVTTPAATSITTTSASLGGNVTGDGGAPITGRGVVFAVTSVNADPLIDGTGVTKITSAGTTGPFTVNAGGLTIATGYSFNAYATNSLGTTYTGPVATFTTSATETGSPDPGYNPNVSGANALAMAAQPDGKTIIGGEFTTVGGQPRANIARLNADGSVDPGFTAGTVGPVYCVAVQADGKILLGGSFTEVNGTPRNRIARLNADGSLESTATFDPGTGADNYVFSMAVQGDGKIVLGGQFTTINDTARKYVARLNADGSIESTATFNPGTGADSLVATVAVQGDGKILLGGFFAKVNGAVRNRIARLNADGTVESTATFNPGTGANNGVFGVALQADGKILLTGSFTEVNGAVRNRIARLDADGTVESTATFNPGTGANDTVWSAALQTDGKILLGGNFVTINGAVRNRIARLNADGTLESTATFDSRAGANSTVYGVAPQADGKILLGGIFSTVNGAARNLIARLNSDAATQSLGATSPARVQWLRGGAGPEVSPVNFELSTDDGASWTPLGGGTRISGGWELTGLGLPLSGTVRARGRTSGGWLNGSGGLVEQTAAFSFSAVNPVITFHPANTTILSGQTANLSVTATGGSLSYQWYQGTSGTTTTPVGTDSPNYTTPNLTATTSYWVRVSNIIGTADSNTATVTVLTALQAWRFNHFGITTNTGLAANTQNPDFDGLLNLAEFAFGTDPTQGGVSQQLPEPQIVAGNYVVTFTQPAGAGGITYGAEWTPSLAPASWTPIPDTGSGTTHTFSVPIGSNEKMFWRFIITEQ